MKRPKHSEDICDSGKLLVIENDNLTTLAIELVQLLVAGMNFL